MTHMLCFVLCPSCWRCLAVWLLGQGFHQRTSDVGREPQLKGQTVLGDQWSVKPSFSVSFRAAGSKLVLHYLFMRCIYGATY